MKKALVVFLALAMVASVFAAEPVAGVAINTFTGSETLTWGVDLDTGRTGFKNAADVTFKIDLVAGGTKETSGEGIWGDIQIKTDGDPFFVMNSEADGDTDAVALPPIKIKVDHAKLHIGPAYVGITSGDTTVGEYKLVSAIRSADNGNAAMNSNVGPEDYKYGITAGYAMDGIFSIDVDFRSHKAQTTTVTTTFTWEEKTNDTGAPISPDGTQYDKNSYVDASGNDIVVYQPITISIADGATYYVKGTTNTSTTADAGIYSNAYAFAGDIALKMVPNANIKLGGAIDFFGGSIEDDKIVSENNAKTYYRITQTLAAYAIADYKVAIGEKFYVLPQVGFTHSTQKVEDTNVYTDVAINTGKIAGGVIFGWGDTKDANAGVPFLDQDATAKKVTPGVSVTVEKELYNKTTSSVKLSDTFSFDYARSTNNSALIAVSAFSGDIVPNLTAGLSYRTAIGDKNVTETNVVYEGGKPVAKDFTEGVSGYEGYEIAFAAKYAIKVGNGTITPNFGFVTTDRWATTARVSKFAKDDTLAYAGTTKYKGSDTNEEVAVDPVGLFNLKVGVEVGGFVPNTTFGVNYNSGNLFANGLETTGGVDADGKYYNKVYKEIGTIDLTCKISL